MEKNISKVRAHDAIVGMTYLVSVVGSMFGNFDHILDPIFDPKPTPKPNQK